MKIRWTEIKYKHFYIKNFSVQSFITVIETKMLQEAATKREGGGGLATKTKELFCGLSKGLQFTVGPTDKVNYRNSFAI